MTDFNQKTHDTDVGSHGGQSRQMMEVFENQEFGSIRLLQEAGKAFFCASDVAKALGYPQQRALHERVAVPDWYSDTKPHLSGENRICSVCKELSVGASDSFSDGSGNQPV